MGQSHPFASYGALATGLHRRCAGDRVRRHVTIHLTEGWRKIIGAPTIGIQATKMTGWWF